MAGGIASAVLAAGSLLGVSITLFVGSHGALVAALLAVGWLVLNAAITSLSFFWPPLRFRHTSYRVDARGIRIRRGVVWRSEISVPRSRVQHTDVSRGPVERGFGLASLTIHTAGTEHATVSLSGLAVDTANAIRNFLIEGGAGDAV